MKVKRISIVVALVMLFTLTFSGVASARIISNTLKATFNVTDPTAVEVENVEQLNNALADSTVTTINLAQGTYEGQFEINRDVTIIGDGAGQTVIQAPDSLSTKFTTSNDNKPVIFVTNGAEPTIKNLTVDGAGKGNSNYRFIGIGFYNAGGTVDNVEIKNIIDTPFSGMQHGVGIYAYNENKEPHELNVTNCTITNYQKNGMAVYGYNMTVDISNNTVTGQGETDVNCQNGIQVSDVAGGVITGNTVSNHRYIKDDQWKGGAVGILVFNVADSNLEVYDNNYSNNDWDFWNNDYDEAVTLTGDIGGEAFVEDTDTEECTATVTLEKDTTVNMNITATVNGIQEFADSYLILDFGAQAGNVNVKVDGTKITPDTNGKFVIGTVIDGLVTQEFTATLIFEAGGTYTADIYVDDGK